MKKKGWIFLAIVVIAVLAAKPDIFSELLGNNDGGTENGGTVENDDSTENGGDSWQISGDIPISHYNDHIEYRIAYTSETECAAGNIDDSVLHSSMEFWEGETYFMVLDFFYSSFEAYGWSENFCASARFSPNTAMDLRLEEAATSEIKDASFGLTREIDATYKIPEDRSESRSYRVIFRMEVLQEEDITVGVAFFEDMTDEEDRDYKATYVTLQTKQGL